MENKTQVPSINKEKTALGIISYCQNVINPQKGVAKTQIPSINKEIIIINLVHFIIYILGFLKSAVPLQYEYEALGT